MSVTAAVSIFVSVLSIGGSTYIIKAPINRPEINAGLEDVPVDLLLFRPDLFFEE